MSDSPPETCEVAFKEWEGVCSALAEGRQTLILRKGGIEEGPNGFEPEHRFFWLYPTVVHQAEQGLKVADFAVMQENPSGTIAIRSRVAVELVEHVDRIETLSDLDAFHVWTEETVLKRFHYRRPGLWVLGVRIYNLPSPVAIAITPEQLGCKTWVPLESPLPTADVIPALVDEIFTERMARLREALRRADLA